MATETVEQWFNSLTGEEKKEAAKSHNAIIKHMNYGQLPQAGSFYQDAVKKSFEAKKDLEEFTQAEKNDERSHND